MATQSLSKSLQYITNTIIQRQCVLWCHITTHTGTNVIPTHAVEKIFTTILVFQVQPLLKDFHRLLWAYRYQAAYREYIREKEKKKKIIMALQKYTFFGHALSDTTLGSSNSLKKEGKNERPHQFTKAKLKNKWHLLLTIAVGNLRGSITATHTHSHTHT